MPLDCLSIEGMSFYAHHGCFAEERKIGTGFIVDIFLYTDSAKARRTDNLEDTVNYAEVYAKIKAEMAIPSHLIEHVAQRIVSRILNDYPAIAKVGIKLSKCNPPLGEKIGQVSFTFEQERE